MAKEMKKITEGRVKERGKKWFPDLADKSKDVCIVVYYPHNNMSYPHLMCIK